MRVTRFLPVFVAVTRGPDALELTIEIEEFAKRPVTGAVDGSEHAVERSRGIYTMNQTADAPSAQTILGPYEIPAPLRAGGTAIQPRRGCDRHFRRGASRRCSGQSAASQSDYRSEAGLLTSTP